MKKKLILVFTAVFLLAGCGGSNEVSSGSPTPLPSQSSAPTPKPTPTPEPTPDLTGLGIDPLTGEYIKEEAVNRRPMAVVINNLNKALPQSGIAQADIIYEVLAEGGITRMIAVFKDFDTVKIGPVRSARHYFLDFALDHDAIFVHHGGSPAAYSSINSLGINNLDGMQLDGKTFKRDEARKNTPGMYEHSSYTGAKLLLDEVATKGYRPELREDYVPTFDFYDEKEKITGDEAIRITVPYAPQSQVGVFDYDKKTNTYLRSQNGKIHIDETVEKEDEQQLRFSNVLVQYTSIYIISGDDAGRREVGLVSQGEGVLFTGGKSIPVLWKKTSHQSPTVWTTEDGDRVKITKGKTWICVFQENGEIIVETQADLTVSPSPTVTP